MSDMNLRIDSCFTLRNGVQMPLLGLGTYQMNEANLCDSVPAALRHGYRLFDTAACYRNEVHLGSCLSKYLGESSTTATPLERTDIFVESKLQPKDQGFEKATAAIDESLRKLGLHFIDLYIVHWPGTKGLAPTNPQNKLNRAGSWRALENALEAGKVRAIGVSNYMVCHLEEMKDYARVMPMVNQFELHPAFVKDELVKYCHENSIAVQAYASLGRGKLLEESFLHAHPLIAEMAMKHNVSFSQIYLRWALQHGYCIIPKSVSENRVCLNGDLYHYSLTREEMCYIDDIHMEASFKTCWDPSVVL